MANRNVVRLGDGAQGRTLPTERHGGSGLNRTTVTIRRAPMQENLMTQQSALEMGFASVLVGAGSRNTVPNLICIQFVGSNIDVSFPFYYWRSSTTHRAVNSSVITDVLRQVVD